jgi:multidrug efflux pump subunit AcrA (membrane-fusion protein)
MKRRTVNFGYLPGASALLLFVVTSIAHASDPATPLVIESVVLRLLEEAEVPAQEGGVLTEVAVREGQCVTKGQLLAQIDDQVARLAAEAAQSQYEIAQAKATNDVRIRFAKKALEVSQA